ncbi:hypothetical protein BH09BAC5_BH09BAC5_19010 [soil metagenome]
MKKYFLHLNGANSGPYSFEDLRAMRIQSSTPVWFDGIANWKFAGDIPELRPLFSATAPGAAPMQSFAKTETRSNYNFVDDNLSGNIPIKKASNKITIVFFAVVVGIIVSVGVFVFIMQQKKEKAYRVEQELYEADNSQKENANDSLTDAVNVAPEVEPPTEVVFSYIGEFNTYVGATLKVTGGDASHLQATIKLETEDGCKGEITGNAIVISEKKIQLRSKEGCKINIKYSNGFVSVTEISGCKSLHGSGCTFDGIYSREK